MLDAKYRHLQDYLRDLGSVAVAFSGGADSALLLKTAHDMLGEWAVAVTAASCTFPQRELDEAKQFCAEQGIRHIICHSEELAIDGFRQNPTNRCYLCKHELFEKILAIAKEEQLAAVAEGSNLDDNGDYRPGLAAVSELGIKSPLREAGLTKAEVRQLSKALNLSTWNKPSFACLASRFVYGETIDERRLAMVDRAEQLLLDLGFHQVRVRVHGTIARIELLPEQMPQIMDSRIRQTVWHQLKALGFTYVTLDMAGYRSGSMNEELSRC